MEQTEFSDHRVLLLGARTHNIQLLRSVLTIVGVGRIVQAEDSAAALALLAIQHFTAIFCALDPEAQIRFALAARRRDCMLNPMIPIFLLEAQVRRRHVEKARDSGATDVLTTPISPKTVAMKLRSATKNPRPFIAAHGFFGPDRRVPSRPVYCVKDRRKKAPRRRAWISSTPENASFSKPQTEC